MDATRLAVLDFVQDQIMRGGEAPSLSEIGEALGISKGRAHRAVLSLVANGVGN
jgi:DNA-binding IclR family transcriptional regulator